MLWFIALKSAKDTIYFSQYTGTVVPIDLRIIFCLQFKVLPLLRPFKIGLRNLDKEILKLYMNTAETAQQRQIRILSSRHRLSNTQVVTNSRKLDSTSVPKTALYKHLIKTAHENLYELWISHLLTEPAL